MSNISATIRRALTFRLRTLMLSVAVLSVAILPAWKRASENSRARALVARFRSVSFSKEATPDPPWPARLLPRRLSREFWPRYGDRVAQISLAGGRATFTDDDLKDLYLFRHLRELSLLGSPITDAGLEHIIALRELEGLDLGGSKVTDEGLKKIATISSLESLGLSDTAVTDDGVRHLTALPRLKTLWLYGTKITDDAADAIGRIRTLEQVGVDQTRFTPTGGAVLRKLLPNVQVWPTDVAPNRPGEFIAPLYRGPGSAPRRAAATAAPTAGK